jgi:hypothetical protein
MGKRVFKLDAALRELSWDSSKKESVRLADVSAVLSGAAGTEIMRAARVDRSVSACCFSLVTAQRSLDLQCKTAEQCDTMVAGFTLLVAQLRAGKQ